MKSLDPSTLELVANKLQIKTKPNGGIETGSTCIPIKYLASDFEIDTTSGLKLKDGVYQKNISITNTTSTDKLNNFVIWYKCIKLRWIICTIYKIYII